MSSATPDSAPHSAQLLEQLMQIARTSALEEMASGIAHELNQPIGAIMTFAQAGERMLSRPEPPVASATEVLQHITNEAQNAGNGIRRIRGLFHRLDGPRENCRIADVLDELRPVLDVLAQRAQVTLGITIDTGLPLVWIDRLRIQHVVYTLVQNAFEAPRRDDVAPEVRITVTGDRYGVVTAITDRGTGIAPAVRDQLFRPFFTTKAHGTGLGLASSRAIIEAHEGTIGVENDDGGGARFWFRLPATTSGMAP